MPNRDRRLELRLSRVSLFLSSSLRLISVNGLLVSSCAWCPRSAQLFRNLYSSHLLAVLVCSVHRLNLIPLRTLDTFLERAACYPPRANAYFHSIRCGLVVAQSQANPSNYIGSVDRQAPALQGKQKPNPWPQRFQAQPRLHTATFVSFRARILGPQSKSAHVIATRTACEKRSGITDRPKLSSKQTKGVIPGPFCLFKAGTGDFLSAPKSHRLATVTCEGADVHQPDDQSCGRPNFMGNIIRFILDDFVRCCSESVEKSSMMRPTADRATLC